MYPTRQAPNFLPSATCAGRVLVIVLLAMGGVDAHAENGAPGWKFSGFGTAGFAHSTEREADFAGSILKADGAGRSASWSRHVDTRLGGQLDLNYGPRWSAVVQVVTEQRQDYSYQPRVEWANVKYQVTPELALRAGRIALPMFIAADYRKVGYAYPWVRTPLEVYNVLPLGSSDGADLTWHWENDSLRSTTQAFYGHTDMALYDGARLRGRAIAGLSHTVERGAFSARASVITTRLTVTLFPELFAALDSFGPQGRGIAARLAADDKRASAASIGLNYDPGRWFVMGEAGRSRVDAYLGSTKSAYASGGVRRGDFTPYAGYARVWGRPPAGVNTLALTGLPPAVQGAGAMLNDNLATILRAIASQSTLTAGLRWDLAENMALKLQHDRVTPRSGSRGMMINAAPGFRSGRTAQVTSAALDFVF
jgi:hypothetical protein